jgi:hypothetical protein
VAAVLRDTRKTLESFKEPLRSLGRVATSVSDVAHVTSDIMAWPRQLIETWWRTIEQATTATYDIWAALSYADRTRRRAAMHDTLAGLNDARRSSLEALGLVSIRSGFSGDTSPIERHSPRLSVTSRRVVKTYPVRQGETLADIAEKELGSRDAWQDIAEINGMYSAYYIYDGRPLLPGDVIYVPVINEAEAAMSAKPDDLFGVDLKIDSDGDLVLAGSDDIQLIRGERNLKQALTVRYRTIQGENGVFPNFGLPRLVGEGNEAGIAGYAASHMTMQSLADPRIKSVGSLSIGDAGDTLGADARLVLVNGTPLNVTVPLV